MEERGSRIVWVLVVVMAIAVGIGFWVMFRKPVSPAATSPDPVEVPRATASAAGAPPIENPLPGTSPQAAMQAPAQPSAEAVEAFRRDLATLGDPAALARFVDPESLVRRIVSTVDGITADELPMRARALGPTPGRFAVARDGDRIVVDPANARRYAPFVAWIESVDTRRAAELYVKHYALFQGEYRAQGGAGRYFNDRLVTAIDHLLATPQPPERIALVQPKVLYRYADPSIESLSAAQKALYRTGRANEARIKAKLRAIRAEVAHHSGSR